MDALKFVKDFRRLCYFYDCCVDCPCFKVSNENCNLLSFDLTDKEIIKYIEIVEEWTKEHPIEIDWLKVPANTPVYVRQRETDEKINRYFEKYYPDSEEPFHCYSGGQTSWSSDGLTSSWPYCELAREEDIEKYAKVEEK